MKQSLFRFSSKLPDNSTISVQEWLTFPMDLTFSQCFDHLTCTHNIPISCKQEFRDQLYEFIEKENNENFQSKYYSWLENIRANRDDLTRMSPKSNAIEKTDIESCTWDHTFMEAYRNIVHSSSASELMNLERSLASVILAEIKQRDDTLRPIDHNLCELIHKPLDGGRISPDSITLLQKDYCMFREAVETKSDQCIEDLKQDQRREFIKFVICLNQKINSDKNKIEEGSSKAAEFNMPLGLIPKSLSLSEDHVSPENNKEKLPSPLPWSETFTVQLGRQIRSTCNFRLIRTDPDEVLNNVNRNTSSLERDIAERLNNALSLYSNTLHGFVILVDQNFDLLSDIKQALIRACERSTEFHFPDLKTQLNSIRRTINCLDERNSDGQLIEQLSKNQSQLINSLRDSNSNSRGPHHGDVYITKHSNLVGDIAGINVGGGIHVVFHVVVDPSQEDQIRAPSALHCALAAILRTCFDYDISSLTLPLLFVSAIRKYMDAGWRDKRAETVLKAIKGALMELITWRGPSLKSIQFLLPSSLPDNELESFSQIISTSFPQPNPLIGTN